MKVYLFILSGLVTMVASGCYYDKEEELYGAATCDMNNISYSGTVAELMNKYGCLSCHSASSPSANINLSNYTGVKMRVSDGSLLGSINHSTGFTPMPQAAGKMSICDISRIKAWIDAGAPNN